jgi:hypothetical protein
MFWLLIRELLAWIITGRHLKVLEHYLLLIKFLASVDDFSEIIVCARARPDANRQPQQICLAPSVFGYWLQVKQCDDFQPLISAHQR